MSRLAKAVIVAVAIAAGGYFGLGKLKPAVETIAGPTSLVQSETKLVTYGYTCDLDGKQFFYNMKPGQKPRKEREVVRKQAVEFDLDVESGSVILRSVNPAINGKILRLTSSKVFSEYQYTGIAERANTEPLIIREEFVILTLVEGKPISIHIQNWPEKDVIERGDGFCRSASEDVGEADNLIKAVFIRTCPGQLYAEFESTGKKPVFAKYKKDPSKLAQIKTIPLGNLGAVCKDLKDSGVTDVFIPFKVDHEGKGCGNYGELLYPSALYPERVSPIVNAAQKRGFDPNGALMNVCGATYGKQPLRFHAWFPVYKDKYAATIQGVEAKKPWFGVIDLFSPSFRSQIFAEPTNQAVVSYELALLQEIIDKYKVIGINLDYIRYPGSGEGDVPSDYTVQLDATAVEEFVRRVKTQFLQTRLSADIFEAEGTRIRLGQNGILTDLDVIIPMAYTAPYYDLTNNRVRQIVAGLRSKYPKATILPVLRGWRCIEETPESLTGCSRTETSEDTKKNLNAGIEAGEEGGAQGYGIFTYEALLNETDTKRLKEIK